MKTFARLLAIPMVFLVGSQGTVAAEGCGCGSIDPENSCTGDRVSYTREGHTIEFEFDCDGGACACGQFANGWDYWVAPQNATGSVNITRMTPDRTGSGSSLRNGAMMDPTSMGDQAFHGGAIANNILSGANMSLLVDAPVKITPSSKGRPSVIVKSKARADSSCQSPDRQCVEYYETLTILQQPPGQVFRPPFFGTEKPLIPLAAFDDTVLSSVAETPGTMSWQEAEATVRSVNVAPMLTYRQTGQGLHALVNNQTGRGYDGYVIQKLNGALMKLAQDPGSNYALKRQLALGVAQMGIDLFYIHKNGANPPGQNYSGYGDFSTIPCGAWPGAGGFNGGRITPIVFSAVLLQRQDWLDVLNENLKSRDGLQCFAETGFIQRNEERRGKGVPTFGHLNTSLYSGIGDCDGNNRNCASVGGSSSASYSLYDGLADGDPLSNTGSPTTYQRCCTLNAWLGAAVVTWLTPAVMEAYPANALHWLTFMDRSKRQGDTAGPGYFGSFDNRSSNAFSTFRTSNYESSGVVSMWSAYGECIRDQSCAGMSDGGVARPKPPVVEVN